MKVICIGRNYLDHAREMSSPIPSEPMFFLKPDTAILKDGNDFYYPSFTTQLHYECEIVVKIDRTGKHIAEKFAHKYYSSFSLGIDFTARDLQQNAKENGLPWELSKAFDQSAPLAQKFLSKEEFDIKKTLFSLQKNGQVVQEGNSQDMIFSIEQIISHVSRYITLKQGDLIYTGTPMGVGSVKIGDVLEGFIENMKMFQFAVK